MFGSAVVSEMSKKDVSQINSIQAVEQNETSLNSVIPFLRYIYICIYIGVHVM